MPNDSITSLVRLDPVVGPNSVDLDRCVQLQGAPLAPATGVETCRSMLQMGVVNIVTSGAVLAPIIRHWAGCVGGSSRSVALC